MAEVQNLHRKEGFTLEEVADPTPESSSAKAAQSAALATLLLALKTISQRAILAFIQLFTLITVGSAFWLWMSIPEPTTHQLISIGMYAAFILAVNAMVLRWRRGT